MVNDVLLQEYTLAMSLVHMDSPALRAMSDRDLVFDIGVQTLDMDTQESRLVEVISGLYPPDIYIHEDEDGESSFIIHPSIQN